MLHSHETQYSSRFHFIELDGQLVVRPCKSESLKYHNYQDIESEVEEQNEKWLAKKNTVATNVNSREVGHRRRNEGKTTTQKHQKPDRRQKEEWRVWHAKAQTRRRRLSILHETCKRRQ